MLVYCLILEIMEISVMVDVDCVIDILVWLCFKNIGMVIDDFGIGYLLLLLLFKLLFMELKIDCFFVNGCENDDDMMKIFEVLVGLVCVFNMKVVVEGVEIVDMFVWIWCVGCDIG